MKVQVKHPTLAVVKIVEKGKVKDWQAAGWLPVVEEKKSDVRATSAVKKEKN